jgi:hypothetical protein
MREPKPLRESAPSDPDLQVGAALLAQVGPSARSEYRKRRVWNALNAGSGSRLGMRLRTLHFAFAGVLFAAASSGAVGHYYVAQRAEQAQPQPRVESPAPVRAKGPTGTGQARPARPALAPVEVAPALPERAQPPVAARSKADAATHPGRAQAEAESQLLVEAMRARRAGDAKRVSALVDEYRAKHPQGALQEEALILSIESAAARRAPNTSALAREYLARFPSGRFAAQARRALTLD